MHAALRKHLAVAAVACPCVALLAGCATNAQLADSIVRANVAQEDAANQLLLLNVLRAKDRHPMHFTKISAVRPSIGAGNPTVTVPMPFGPDFKTQIYNLQAQFAVQQGVDTVVLDSQEFMRGITTPVSPSLMAYMLDQGWPQQLVLHMFVKSIEIYEDTQQDGKEKSVMIGRLDNSPTNPAQFNQFQEAIDQLRSCEIDVKPAVVGRVPFGPPQAASTMADLKGLAAVKTAEMNIQPVVADRATTYQLVREQKAVQFEIKDRPESLPAKCEGIRFTAVRSVQIAPTSTGSATGNTVATATNSVTTATSRVSLMGTLMHDQQPSTSRQAAAQSLRAEMDGGRDKSKPYAIFNLRSPEAMLYYLGEIVRYQSAHPEFNGPRIKFRPRPNEQGDAILFRLTQGAWQDPSAPVSVTYRGTSYAVGPSSDGDRSMHTLSLVQQILMLQNKGTETPGTTNVRILQ